MSNPTTPFSWQMPTSTDLVTNLPADFEVFGQAVATSMADLLGGTTGQVLSKTTNTDMDFTWVSPNPGDITAVNVTSPITGGGTSGDVTIGIQAGSTTQSGAVQLTDSTSSTSTTTAATPNAVKTSYDLAAAAIAKSTVTTAGDIIYRNATVPTRLGIGTAGQVLKVNSGATAPEWATAVTGASAYGKTLSAGSNKSTTSTSYVAIDTTNLRIAATPSGTTAVCYMQAQTSNSSVSNSDWRVNCGSGTTYGFQSYNSSYMGTVVFTTVISVITGLTAGTSYNFDWEWKVNAGTSLMIGDTAVTYPRFTVVC